MQYVQAEQFSKLVFRTIVLYSCISVVDFDRMMIVILGEHAYLYIMLWVHKKMLNTKMKFYVVYTISDVKSSRNLFPECLCVCMCV